MPRWIAILVLSLGLVASIVSPASASAPTPPPTGTDFDYQLGGKAPLPANVGIVVRDRSAKPAKHAYSICYVNGFQTQPDEKRFWRHGHPRLLLREDGRPVKDEV